MVSLPCNARLAATRFSAATAGDESPDSDEGEGYGRAGFFRCGGHSGQQRPQYHCSQTPLISVGQQTLAALQAWRICANGGAGRRGRGWQP